MTALSKATLKATWVANFKPRESDFANLIDSWTDYYASLESLGAATKSWAGASTDVRVPVFVDAASARVINAGNVATLIGRYNTIPASPSNQILSATSVTAVAWFNPAGLQISSVGTSSFNAGTNYVSLWSYDPRGDDNNNGNTLEFFRIRGTQRQYDVTTPNTALASGRVVGNIIWRTTAVSGYFGDIFPAEIRGVISGPVTTGNCPMEIAFRVSTSGISTATPPQFSIGQGFANFQPVSGPPTSPRAGSVYYDSSTNKLRCYNGTSWNDLF